MKTLATIATCLALSGTVFADTNSGSLTYGNNRNQTTGDVSVCVWMKPTEDAGSDFGLGKKNDIAAAAGYALYQNSSDFYNFRVADGTDDALATSDNDYDGSWRWLCGDWVDSTKTASLYHSNTLYFPAELEASNTDALVGSLSNAVQLTVGADGAGGNGENANITMGHVYVGKILTEAERNQIEYMPGTVAADSETNWSFMPLFGIDSPEPTVGGSTLSGVTTASSANDGPPVSFGSGIPL